MSPVPPTLSPPFGRQTGKGSIVYKVYASASAKDANEHNFFRVKLAAYNAGGKCSCGEWADKGLPCSHAVQALMVANKAAGRQGCGLDIVDLVYRAYRLDEYTSSYRTPVSLGHMTREELSKDGGMLAPEELKQPVSVAVAVMNVL